MKVSIYATRYLDHVKLIIQIVLKNPVNMRSYRFKSFFFVVSVIVKVLKKTTNTSKVYDYKDLGHLRNYNQDIIWQKDAHINFKNKSK